MTLNFPSSPSDQDTYSGYVYNAAKGVWKKIASTTDNISEGSTNLYFTGQRALDATDAAYDAAGSAATAESNAISTSNSYTDTTVADYAPLAGATFTGNVVLNSDPTQALGAATKQYVDSLGEGLVAKPAVKASTSLNATGTYDNGTSGVGATFTFPAMATFNIDGVTSWNLYDGLLLRSQTNAAENGRYVLTTVGDGSTPWVFTRCGLCDEADEIPGAYIFVTDGINSGQTGWVLHVDDPATFTVGTDDIDVFQFAGAGTYTAGNGLELTGTQFSIDNTVTATQTDVSDARTAAESYADGLAVNYDPAGSASTAESNANTFTTNSINALDTDDIEEGSTNLYFTNQRAIDAVGENLALDALSDVATSGVNDGDALVYDTATTSWVPGSVAIDALNDINDVTITTPADNEVLAYDTSSGDWINQTPAEAGIATTSSLDSKVDTVNGTVTTASTSSGVVRNIYTSTSVPSGGMDGDIWIVYS